MTNSDLGHLQKLPKETNEEDTEEEEIGVEGDDSSQVSSLLLQLDQIGASVAEEGSNTATNNIDGNSKLDDSGPNWNCNSCKFNNKVLITYCQTCFEVRDLYKDDPEFLKAIQENNRNRLRQLEARIQNQLAAFDSTPISSSDSLSRKSSSSSPSKSIDLTQPNNSQEWSCPTCTFLNAITSSSCSMCRTNCPINFKKEESWSCVYCTFQNKAHYLVCEMCEKPKMFDQSFVPPSSEVIPFTSLPSKNSSTEEVALNSNLKKRKHEEDEEKENLKDQISKLKEQVSSLQKNLSKVTADLVTYQLEDFSFASPTKNNDTSPSQKKRKVFNLNLEEDKVSNHNDQHSQQQVQQQPIQPNPQPNPQTQEESEFDEVDI